MGLVSNIVCKTVGIAGLAAVTYDAYSMAQHHSSALAAEMTADVFEKTVAAQRSNSSASYTAGAMQNKVADLRMKNPIVPVYGKVKGFVEGFISTLGDTVIPIIFSSIALGAKGKIQKAGAWGVGIFGLYQIAKEGFGLGKTAPIDE